MWSPWDVPAKKKRLTISSSSSNIHNSNNQNALISFNLPSTNIFSNKIPNINHSKIVFNSTIKEVDYIFIKLL